MPKLFLPVPEVEKSVTRPTILSIIREVKEITGIPKEAKEVFLGDARSAAQRGSTVGSDTLNNTNIAASNQLTIEVTESYNENYAGTTAIAQAEQIPIFIDDDLGIVIKPIYTSRTFDISVRYRNTSKTHAKAWRDGIYMSVSHLRDVNLHTATYHYSMPKPILVLLQELHRLREVIEPYNEDFEQYFINGSTTRMTELSNLNGTYSQAVVAEQQVRIQGMFDFTMAPERGQTGDDANMWLSEFTYKFTMDIPTGIHIQYPIMVHNQILEDKYIPQPVNDHDEKDLAFSRSLKALHRFEVPVDNQYQKMRGMIVLPDGDDWYGDNKPMDTVMILSALCQINPDDKHTFLNLNELGDYHLDEEIMEYFKNVEYRYLTKPYQSPFLISYYRNKFLSSDRDIFINADLDVKHRDGVSLRDNHRIVFSVVSDVGSIDIRAWKRMKMYPNVLRKTLLTMGVSYGELTKLSPRIDLTKYVDHLPKVGLTKEEVFQRYVRMHTVNLAYIVARNGMETLSLSQEHSTKRADPFVPIRL